MKDFKGFKKGVDLGGWLSQCDYSDKRLNHFIEEEDFKKIASWGADHVRLPFDYNIIEEEDGTRKPEGFAHIDRAIKWAKENNLNIVLDLHKTAGFSFYFGEGQIGFFDDPALQERFYVLWEDMSKRYGNDPAIAFELLNEVTDQEYSDRWNKIIKTAIGRIRKIASDTVILVGGYWNNSPAAVKDLEAPYDDKVVYNIHCYDPLFFTHQGAMWIREMDHSLRFTYEESKATKEYFLGAFKEAYDKAVANNTTLYCGEYGVIENATPEDTLKWYKAINAAFEELNIGRSAWSYKSMNFGLSDKRMAGVIDELVKYL
jgi:aryl-phospho-beta-D-glucosidase BglC (GH1 family)